MVCVEEPLTKNPPSPTDTVGALGVPGGASGVTAVAVVPAWPSPAGLEATTLKLYDVVVDRPVQVAVVPVVHVHVPAEPCPVGTAVTV